MLVSSIRKIVFASVLAGAVMASAAPATYTGVLTDDMCGVGKHMLPGKSDADCVRECVKSGSKYALAVGKKLYILSGDAKQFDPLAGKKVTVTGETKGNTLEVKSIAAAK